MTEKLTLIDSDVYIGILRRERTAYQNARSYLSKYGRFKISCLTWYECLRGYLTIGATNRLRTFQEMTTITDVVYLDETILQRAAEFYAFSHNKGRLTGEFDLLIGTTAIINGWKLATNNERHYELLKEQVGLEIENWITTIF